jgi:hypothetical protein
VKLRVHLLLASKFFKAGTDFGESSLPEGLAEYRVEEPEPLKSPEGPKEPRRFSSKSMLQKKA